MKRQTIVLTLTLLAAIMSPNVVQAQVFGSGPSDPALFDTVINLPPDPNIGDSAIIGSGTQVNVADGGSVGFFVDAQSGSEVNISGGNLRLSFDALSGSEVNVSGGAVGNSFEAHSGSEVSISGGTFGSGFIANPGSAVKLSGGEFRLNDAVYTDTTITLGEEDVFTGTLADGSSFIFFAAFGGDALSGVTLSDVPLPILDTTPVVIDSPVTSGPSGLRDGQTLSVVDGGVLSSHFAVVDATLNVQGGTVGFGGEVVGGAVNISGGTVGSFTSHAGSELNITGGVVDRVEARAGSTVDISGGTVGTNSIEGNRFLAGSGSTVNISSGTIGPGFTAVSGSEVNISGGAVGEALYAASGSIVELSGGEFRLNGAPFNDTSISFESAGVFTGTLADGSSFIFALDLRTLTDFSQSPFVPPPSFVVGDGLSDANLSAVALPALDTAPVVINTPVITGPSGLRAGQTLTLVDGGSLRDQFAVVDATLNVQGGTIGSGCETAGGIVNISGGNVGPNLRAYIGSEVNVSGGVVDSGFEALTDSTVNISGGTVAQGFEAAGATVNISGGTVDSGLEVYTGSTVNISGGSVGSELEAIESTVNISGGAVGDGFIASFSTVNVSGGSVGNDFIIRRDSILNISGGSMGVGFPFDRNVEVNIFGTQFLLNGQLLEGLVIDEPFTITANFPELSGVLADGSPFDFTSTPEFGPVFRGATLTVTLTEPNVLLGDVNLDGVVNFLDISSFIGVLSAGGFQAEADCNEDGSVNFLDISVFISILSSE